MKRFFLVAFMPVLTWCAAEQKVELSNAVGPACTEEDALVEILGAAHVCAEGQAAGKQILNLCQQLTVQLPCSDQTFRNAAITLNAMLKKYDIPTLISAGKYLLLNGDILAATCIKVHIAQLFIQDHSDRMITQLQDISPQGHLLLALQILRISGAEELMKNKANQQYIDHSLLNYTALARIVDVTLQIRAGEKVTLDPDKEPSFTGWVLNCMKNLIMNHNQELLAVGGAAVSVISKACCVLL